MPAHGFDLTRHRLRKLFGEVFYVKQGLCPWIHPGRDEGVGLVQGQDVAGIRLTRTYTLRHVVAGRKSSNKNFKDVGWFSVSVSHAVPNMLSKYPCLLRLYV